MSERDYLASSRLVVDVVGSGRVEYPILTHEQWADIYYLCHGYADHHRHHHHRQPETFCLSLLEQPTDLADAIQIACDLMGWARDVTRGDRRRTARWAKRKVADRAEPDPNSNAPGGSWDHQGR